MRFDYECSKEECGFLFEVEQPLKARKLRKCPVCGKRSLERVILEAPLGFVRGDVTTVGQLSERNAKAMGAEAVELEKKHLVRQEEFARKSRMENLRKKMPAGAKLLGVGNTDKPWYGKMDKGMEKTINTDTTGSKAHKYIMEGK